MYKSLSCFERCDGSRKEEVIVMTKEYRFIGKPTPRKDAVEIVTGKAKFIDDIKLPAMLYGRVLRSPYSHANIKNIDTSKAEVLPGVEAVLTYKNVPDWKAGWPRHICVLDCKVRFVGDGVALVAAKTEGIAEEALELIDVEYEQLPAVYDAGEAMKPDAPQLYNEFSRNILPPDYPPFGPKSLKEVILGDVENGFREADFTSEGTYVYEGISNPLPIEPPGVIAKWDGPNKLTVWSASQSVSWPRFMMQPIMGFPDIRSIGEHCGGSYGSKNNSFQPLFYAAALAKATGKPVKIFYTKEEQFCASVLRLGSRFHGKVGMKKDGTVTAISGDWVVNTGAFSDVAQAQVAVGLGEAQLMLRCPNWNVKSKIVFTNRNASGIVKGFGGQELKSAFIPILTMAMEKADLDPVEFFKKNYVKTGDGYYWRDGKRWVCRGLDYSKAIEKGAEVFGWEEKWKGWLKPTAVNGSKRIGVGVGVHGNADVGENMSEAYVRLNPDATATIHLCISESGMGQRSSVCKMVAEVLQLPLERVNVTPADSLLNPFEAGLIGSRGTYAVGSAVIAAAEDARRILFERSAPLFNVTPEDLESEDGIVYVKNRPEIRIPWRRVMGIRGTCTGFGRFEEDFSVPNFLMIFVEVEVDVETGKVELLRVVPATDVGQIIDPLVLEGQIHGCLGAAGLDTALFEESVLDKASGRILNGNMIDYKWRTFLELPTFQNVILETPFPTHRFKAIGVGEITSVPGPSAIIMAVSNAVGKRLFEYPLTPDRILKALGKIK
jgi:xanthine dehydrogenase molybdenum-binding subunit